VLLLAVCCSVDGEQPPSLAAGGAPTSGGASGASSIGAGQGGDDSPSAGAGAESAGGGPLGDAGAAGAASAGGSESAGAGTGNGGSDALGSGGAPQGGAAGEAGASGSAGDGGTAGTPNICPEISIPALIEPSAEFAPECDASTYTATLDVAYAAGDAHLLDLFVPSDASGPVPLVVSMHGNGWLGGTRKDTSQIKRLLCRGYAVASVDYRLTGEIGFPAQIADVKAAIRYLRANAETLGVDATRFAAFGSSAGGHLAALAGLSSVAAWDDEALGNEGVSSAVQAVIDWYGPSSLGVMDADAIEQGCAEQYQNHGDADSAESLLVGCTVSEPACADEIAEASPVTYASASAPPTILFHGSEDCIMPRGQSVRLQAALQAAGACSSHHVVSGAGHNTDEWESPEVQDAIADFLDLVLAPAQ
jgi:acetyl esterase/lipase